MTISGWIFMSVSWISIIGMFVYCLYRTLRSNNKEKSEDQ